MQVLIVPTNFVGNSVVLEMSNVPRIGDCVDLFYKQPPPVTSVIWAPSKDRLRALGFEDYKIEVIVCVS